MSLPWTSFQREHYDALVSHAASIAELPARTTSSIRGALGVGFAAVFGLWVFSGYGLIRSLHDAEDRVTVAQRQLESGNGVLSTIRTNVLLGSLYLRDTLIDSGAIARDYYRDEIRRIRDEIEQQLPHYLLEVELPIERQHWAALQRSLDEYWAVLDLAFSPDLPSNTAQAASLLRRRVGPARTNVLSLLDNIAALQQLAQQRHEVERAVMYEEVRRRFVTVASGSLVLALLVAYFAFRHVAGLEREIHRQRIAEANTRHDLQRLSARLVAAQEDERRSLARELHDEVGQALTAIKMDMGVALRSVDADPRARASLEEARSIAEATLQNVRDLSQLLHPSMLDDFGLPATLRTYLRSWSKRTGIRAQLSHDGFDGRIPPETEVCIYRIVQEALTNVARHSGASTCSVAMARDEGELRVIVDDNGQGIGAADASGEVRRGLGLIGMRERAQALSGRFVIENRIDGGTRVTVRLPVPPQLEGVGQRLAG